MTAPSRVPLSNSGARQGGTTGGVAPHLFDVDARPPVKCPGGKTKLLPELRKRMPSKFGAYFEPFVGGGALFFDLVPKKAFIADANPHLIKMYLAIRDDVDALIRELRKSRYKNDSVAYYRMRNGFFTKKETVAAEYIYANRVCFNGIFRVNQNGFFNVPFGRYTNPTICDADNLRACALALRNAHILCCDFQATTVQARKNDFVYFDCPYWPVSSTANFRGYTAGGFGPADQVRLHDEAVRLKKLGVHVLLSNADVPAVRELYKKGFRIDRVEAARAINSDGAKRGKVGELLIY